MEVHVKLSWPLLFTKSIAALNNCCYILKFVDIGHLTLRLEYPTPDCIDTGSFASSKDTKHNRNKYCIKAKCSGFRMVLAYKS